jgi:hypothetical protein
MLTASKHLDDGNGTALRKLNKAESNGTFSNANGPARAGHKHPARESLRAWRSRVFSKPLRKDALNKFLRGR